MKLYHIDDKKIKFSFMCRNNMKKNKTYKYPEFFFFAVKLCDPCFLTAFSVLITTSREIIKLC